MTWNPSHIVNVEIESFGYLHGDAPKADIVFDLRRRFRDPHVSPELRHLTAEDDLVVDAVLNTPGVAQLVEAAAAAVTAYASGPAGPGTVVVAAGCAGGRHRAAVFAQALAHRLYADGYMVAIHHRDLRKPVVER